MAKQLLFYESAVPVSSARHADLSIEMGAGYAFGNVPFVKENFEVVAIGIVLVSLLPMVIEIIRHRARRSPL